MEFYVAGKKQSNLILASKVLLLGGSQHLWREFFWFKWFEKIEINKISFFMQSIFCN